MKKVYIFLAILVILLLAVSFSALADSGIPIELEGMVLTDNAYLSDGVFYLPLRAVLEPFGYTVKWSDTDGIKSLLVSNEQHNIYLNLSDNKINIDGHVSCLSGNFNGAAYIVLSDSIYLELGILADNFGLDINYNEDNAKMIINSKDLNPIAIKTENIVFSSNNLNTNIQYPQIFGLENAEIMDSINETYREAALDAEREGLQNAYEMQKYLEEGYTGSPNGCETYFDYDIKYNENGILSIVFWDYQYSGGAHGGTVQSSYTFDLESGNILSLNDLFNEGVDYTAYIDGVVREEIDQRVSEGLLFEFDFSPFVTIGSDPDFYIEDHPVVVYFQQYEYFPYAAGIQEFSIVFSKNDAMLKDDFDFLYQAPLIWQLSAEAENTLFKGSIGRVILDGSPTTGYTWHYTIGDNDIVKLDSQDYVVDSRLTGAGGSYIWDFKALKDGETEITFEYYRDWEGAETSTKTVSYRVKVK